MNLSKIIGIGFFTLLVSVFLALMCAPAIIHFSTKDKVEFVVKKQEVFYKHEEPKYLVFTDKEVFENTDSIFAWKFDSSDIQSKLEPGKKCIAKVVGIRIPMASSYRNILEADCR